MGDSRIGLAAPALTTRDYRPNASLARSWLGAVDLRRDGRDAGIPRLKPSRSGSKLRTPCRGRLFRHARCRPVGTIVPQPAFALASVNQSGFSRQIQPSI